MTQWVAKRISAAEAKARLGELLGRVAYGGDRYVIERRGQPMAALVAVSELERLDVPASSATQAGDLLGLVGAWGDVPDEEIDAFIAHVYAERERDLGRPVEIEE